MEFLNKFTQFARQHYEKLALSLALLILAIAVVGIYFESSRQQEQIQTYIADVGRTPSAVIPPLDLKRIDSGIQRAKTPPELDLSSPHHLFNPVKWLKQNDGTFIKSIKGTEATLDQLQITNIRPLLTIIAFEKFTGAGYTITTTNEALSGPLRRIPGFYTLNDTNKPVLILREVQGPPSEPAGLVVELKESGERVTIGPGKPFVRTNTFEVDLKYLGGRTFRGQRVNSTINLGGEEYKIVAIAANEVVFSAPNDKKYTVRYAAQR